MANEHLLAPQQIQARSGRKVVEGLNTPTGLRKAQRWLLNNLDLHHNCRCHGLTLWWGNQVNLTNWLLRVCANRAIRVYQKHDYAASIDAGFDAGEFSGPASDRAAEREVVALAHSFGFTIEEVDAEVQRICNE